MYFYIDGMFTRAEDPRNRTMSDLYSLEAQLAGQVCVHCSLQYDV